MPTRQRSPTSASLTSMPSVVRFSPNWPSRICCAELARPRSRGPRGRRRRRPGRRHRGARCRHLVALEAERADRDRAGDRALVDRRCGRCRPSRAPAGVPTLTEIRVALTPTSIALSPGRPWRSRCTVVIQSRSSTRAPRSARAASSTAQLALSTIRTTTQSRARSSSSPAASTSVWNRRRTPSRTSPRRRRARPSGSTASAPARSAGRRDIGLGSITSHGSRSAASTFS